MSGAGGLENALWGGQEIGATTIQLFTRNQKRWNVPPINEEEKARWQFAVEKTGISHVMSHSSYLINLGSPDPEMGKKSLGAFREELQRCQALNLTFLNFHPGAALKSPKEECLEVIVKRLKSLKDLTEKGHTRLLIETTAGQGSTVGATFEELAFLVDQLKDHIPIGVCIDTCHIFAAGYDIRTPKAWQVTLNHFDQTVGLPHLHALHLNDSLCDLGSRKDRHASLGEGKIGLACFQALMENPHLRKRPLYLETPEGPPVWKKEIAWLRKLCV